mmetsp:Transcript_29169/g.96730  ORF Transcript_29169/g.96730 Transcript_29169/m.96730 type:complete len:330 (+) Transcript_29169:194-1183(+)
MPTQAGATTQGLSSRVPGDGDGHYLPHLEHRRKRGNASLARRQNGTETHHRSNYERLRRFPAPRVWLSRQSSLARALRSSSSSSSVSYPFSSRARRASSRVPICRRRSASAMARSASSRRIPSSTESECSPGTSPVCSCSITAPYESLPPAPARISMREPGARESCCSPGSVSFSARGGGGGGAGNEPPFSLRAAATASSSSCSCATPRSESSAAWEHASSETSAASRPASSSPSSRSALAAAAAPRARASSASSAFLARLAARRRETLRVREAAASSGLSAHASSHPARASARSARRASRSRRNASSRAAACRRCFRRTSWQPAASSG